MVRVVVAFIAAVFVCFLAGAASLTWFDGASFTAAGGGAVDPAALLGWYGQNLNGLAVAVKTYPQLLAAGLFIAFIAAAIVKRFAPGLRFWWYAGAGAVALLVMVVSLKLALGLMVLPGARTAGGLAGQVVAGFLGGATFALLSRRSGSPR